MTVVTEKMREIVMLESQAKDAINQLEEVSRLLLTKHRLLLKIDGWDWHRRGETASILLDSCPEIKIVLSGDRPC